MHDGGEREPVPTRRAQARLSARGGLALHLAVVGLATLGFNKIRLGAWTVSDLLFLFSAVVICLKLLAGSTSDLAPTTMRKTSPAILLATVVLVIAGTISSLQSFNAAGSMQMVARVVWITLAWFWVLRSVSPNRGTLRALLRGFRFTVLASCLAAIAGYFGLVSLTPANNENREAAFFWHPNELGGLLAVALPFVLLGVLHGRGKGAESMTRRLVFIALIAFAVTTTGSMTSVLSCVVGGAVVAMLSVLAQNPARRRFRTPVPYFLATLACAGGLVWLASSDLPVVNRFSDVGEEGSQVSKSVGSREGINTIILGNFDDYLIVGVGLDADTTDLLRGDTTASRVHNMYLKLLYEAGIPGLLGLIVILLVTIRQGWRLLINTRGDPLNPLVIALLASLASASFFALFQPLFAQRYYWFPVAMIGVVWALRREEAREAGQLRDQTGSATAARLPQRSRPSPS